MDAFLVSSAIVAIAEIGDKTQLLALVLAARYRRPLPIIAGIFLATIANHAGAAWVGAMVGSWLTRDLLLWGLAVSFLAMAAWTLVPDSFDEDEDGKGNALTRRLGAFGTTLVLFFFVEIGDKTQIATIALAARFSDLLTVTMGTTLGMMLANVPVVFLGEAAARIVPLRYVRWAAAGLFALLGGMAVVEVLRTA